MLLGAPGLTTRNKKLLGASRSGRGGKANGVRFNPVELHVLFLDARRWWLTAEVSCSRIPIFTIRINIHRHPSFYFCF